MLADKVKELLRDRAAAKARSPRSQVDPKGGHADDGSLPIVHVRDAVFYDTDEGRRGAGRSWAAPNAGKAPIVGAGGEGHLGGPKDTNRAKDRPGRTANDVDVDVPAPDNANKQA